MLKIYGHFFSAPSNKVRLCASALGLEFDYQHIELSKGEHKTPEYLAINPVGKVPAIDDNGFRLFESDAIIRYLARKQPSPLYPEDNHVRAEIDQWIEFSYNHILTNMGMILFNRRFAPSMGAEPNEKSIIDGERYLNHYLPVVDKHLAKHEFLCGDAMTLADIAMLASMEPFEFAAYDASAYTAVQAWRKTIMKKEFYQKIHSHYAAELPPRD